jgi:murein DD-endopeptidase MepM/ murein hydrolase activator NlpD
MTKLIFLQYLLEVSVIITVLFGLYRIFFARLSHFFHNRLFLTIGLGMAFIAPLIHIPVELGTPPMGWESPIPLALDEPSFADSDAVVSTLPVVQKPKLDWFNIVWWLYCIGALCMASYTASRFLMLFKQLRKAKSSGIATRVFYTHYPHTFSFGRKVYLGKDYSTLSADQQAMVLNHEQTHIRQKHSIDSVLFQLVKIICWFHPLLPAWGRDLRQQHEYLADQATIRQFQRKRPYANLILQMSTDRRSSFIHSFAFFPLKKRISMLFQTSPSRTKWYYLAALPVVLIFLCSFSFQTEPPKSAPAQGSVMLEPDVPSIKPVNGNITSGFGMRMHPIRKLKKLHKGVDFRAPMGTPVMATANGIITEVRDSVQNKGYGNYIMIDHGGGIKTRYAQLSEMMVTIGQKVEKSDIIAKTGNSGMSTAPHLHYEIMVDGKAVDPAGYFSE